MKKLSQIFSALLIAVVSLFTTTANVYAQEVPTTISLGSSEYHADGLVAGVGFDYKILSDREYVFCLDYYKSTPRNVSMSLYGEMDAGMTYILANSFPNKQITDDWTYNYYITQTAIWWYLDLTTGSSNLPSSFKNGQNDSVGIYKYIKSLVDGALEAQKTGYVQPAISVTPASNDMTLSDDGTYYLSGAFTVNGTNLAKDADVTLSNDAPEGSQIVDGDMNAKTSFAVGEKLYVKVPASSVEEGETISFNISLKSNGIVKKVYEYRSSNSSLQRIVTPTLYTTTIDVATTATLAVTKTATETVKTKVEIVKVDASDNQILAGAKLVLKDQDGNIVKNAQGKELVWITSETAFVVEDLPFGTYTIEELEAPEGYDLSTVKVTFELTKENPTLKITFNNNKTSVVPEEPTEIVEVPDTASNTIIYGLLGTCLVAGGIVVARRHAKKNN